MDRRRARRGRARGGGNRRRHIDAVRVPLNEDCWLGINGVTVAGGIVGSNCMALAALPSDPDHQLGLSFHVYSWTGCRTSACWGSIHRLTTAARIPLVTTEFGEDDCRNDFMRTYISWADANQVSYLAWTWTVNLHRVCVPGFAGQGADLSLLQSWSGTPSRVSPEASALHARLAADLQQTMTSQTVQ